MIKSLSVLFGIIAGLAVGLGVMFIGGLVQAVDSMTGAGPVNSLGFAVGVTRVALAVPAGWLAAVIFVIPAFLQHQKQK